MRNGKVSRIVLVLIFVGSIGHLWARPGKKILTLKDYSQWNHITASSISPDGRWMYYVLKPNGGEEVLHIKPINATKANKIPQAGRAVFSPDSKFIIYRISPSKKERERSEKFKTPLTPRIVLLNLYSGKKVQYDNVSAYKISGNSAFLAVKIKSPGKRKHKGSDLVIHDLKRETNVSIGNVSQFSFNKKGNLLAYLIDAAGKLGNGVYLYNLIKGYSRALDTRPADYSHLTWDDAGSSKKEGEKLGRALAVLRGVTPDKKVKRQNTIVLIKNLTGNKPVKILYDPSRDKNFPPGMVISENGNLNLQEDLSGIYFGISKQEPRQEKKKKEDEGKPDVEVWHYKDPYLQSVQKIRAPRDKMFTFRSACWFTPRKFVQLTGPKMKYINIPRKGSYGIGMDQSRYLPAASWGQYTADYYRINLKTGRRILLLEGSRGYFRRISPEGKHFLYFKGGHFWLYTFADNRTLNLSKKAPVSFANTVSDYLGERRPFGFAGWVQDQKSILVYDQFDIWRLYFTGKKAVNLTGGWGAEEKIVLRIIKLDSENPYLNLNRPVLLSGYGEWTKKSGFFQLRNTRPPKMLIYKHRRFARLTKALQADQVLFTSETFVDFPNLYSSGMNFKKISRQSDANPQQKDYAWGRRILIDYQNSRKIPLQATLTLPADYQEGRKYPMLVYFYQKMSYRHHHYSMPTYDDRPHMSTYASDGYLVLMPDIVYTPGKPGSSALDCISAAVKKVIELGFADPERIGLQGHSWGGYQSSYLVTQTDLFACVVTGAPLTDLVSMYNILYKSTGSANQRGLEWGQGRMGTDPWKNLTLYIEQSPLHHAHKITTPFMILHGTNDGAVDWNQGLELFTAARRLGKEVVLLSYPGEPHHLSKEENQKDFQRRMKQYFDHYLKHKPAPRWLKEGIPYLEKNK